MAEKRMRFRLSCCETTPVASGSVLLAFFEALTTLDAMRHAIAARTQEQAPTIQGSLVPRNIHAL
jgi:hypothetical protein